jgi:hypothetical protein
MTLLLLLGGAAGATGSRAAAASIDKPRIMCTTTCRSSDGVMRSYGTRSPLQDRTRIIEIKIWMLMPH